MIGRCLRMTSIGGGSELAAGGNHGKYLAKYTFRFILVSRERVSEGMIPTPATAPVQPSDAAAVAHRPGAPTHARLEA